MSFYVRVQCLVMVQKWHQAPVCADAELPHAPVTPMSFGYQTFLVPCQFDAWHVVPSAAQSAHPVMLHMRRGFN